MHPEYRHRPRIARSSCNCCDDVTLPSVTIEIDLKVVDEYWVSDFSGETPSRRFRVINGGKRDSSIVAY
jgi:hypothetical protein